MKLANWTKTGLTEIHGAFVEFLICINWPLLIGGTLMALALAGGFSLPWLTD